jgi:hypothetical protein
MMTRLSVLTLVCIVCVLLGLSGFAGADTAGFLSFGSVSPQDVIFAAAGNAGDAAAIIAAFSQNGTTAFPPLQISLGSYGAGALVTFNGVSGIVSCCSGASPNGPDGNPGTTALSAYKSISGFSAPSTMALVGVFTSGTPAACNYDSEF